jgi:hypothetical protein
LQLSQLIFTDQHFTFTLFFVPVFIIFYGKHQAAGRDGSGEIYIGVKTEKITNERFEFGKVKISICKPSSGGKPYKRNEHQKQKQHEKEEEKLSVFFLGNESWKKEVNSRITK